MSGHAQSLVPPLSDTTQPGPFDSTKDEKHSSTRAISMVESDETGYDTRFMRRTMLWLDIRILPMLSLVYSFALIDRINLGSAYAAGMDVTLGLREGARFSLVTLLFFIPYTLLQLPGNLVLRRVGVRNWLSFLIFAWGTVQLGMGFVDTWTELLGTRILLGVFEAPFFPAMFWLISAWYKRHEVQKRLAAFYLLSVTASGLSPLLAYGLSFLDGRGKLEGWRWIFASCRHSRLTVVEGLITIFLAVVCFLFVPGFPEEAKFLDEKQRRFVLERINEDRGDALPDEITKEKVFKHLRDWTLWAYGFIFMCAAMPNYAQSIFTPIILRGMGYEAKDALLRTVPPYIASIPTTILVAWLADRHKHRSSYILLTCCICTVGSGITAWHPSHHVRYFGVFLTNIGSAGSVPTFLAYSANNVVGHSKRSVQSALMVGFGSVGGMLAAACFRSQDDPRYVPGLVATMVSQALLVVVVGVLTARHMYWNKRAREGRLCEPLEGQPGFYYTL
ncbi:MFS general substrate transporter [Coprinopsis marcescibilis]|uniref:MFS general substrate transporter n=1 Tax=Coprinopsis marcescibilis TaxID=230819 RepID=A0A5C3LA08_COPMA|nr:MFS general substrate transporter [Coprinopsis marcescibilis]